MPGYFNIDKAVKHIKIIADNNRCKTCDKLLGPRMRYACGHIACKECIEESDECLTCFDSSQKLAPIIDTAQSQHAQNVFNLLTSFQETFNIDVNKRHRLSEKLKEEQQFFPECIQASITYNKRTSSQIFTKVDKENNTPFVIAGEQISPLKLLTMNTRINLVQKWLESNENNQRPVRKPFTDINVNRSFLTSKENKNNSKQLQSKKICIKKNKNYVNKNKHIESAKQKKSSENLSVSPLKQYELRKTIKDKHPMTELKSSTILKVQENLKFYNCQTEKRCSNENLDIIVIEDTPVQEFDKDKEAWLAVLETEKKLSNCKKTNNTDNYDRSITQALTIVPADVLNKRKNVSYYKKAPLYKSCQLSLNGSKDDFTEYQKFHSKDVYVTVNTRSITTSIKITNNEFDTKCKNSTSTQTVEVNEGNKNMHICSIPVDDKQSNITSQDLFVKDTDLFTEDSKIPKKENLINKTLHKSSDLPYQVVNDSDSDSDIHCSGTFEVIAEVYTPSEKGDGVLSAITNENNYKRLRQSCRRRTVDSNNSSEKENVEPNRPKKPRLGKKQDKKKEFL